MSTETMIKCDQCGETGPYGECIRLWYTLELSRAYDFRLGDCSAKYHACSPKCAAPLLVKLFGEIGSDAANIAKKEKDEAKISAVASESEAGARLLGAAIASVVGGLAE